MNNEAQIPQNDLSSALMEEKGSADADQFERAEMAEKLVRLISNQSNPLTISIDGEWGSGKTFFLEILQEQLGKKEFECIYFNAWEDDSLKKDPLVAIIGRLFKHFGEKPNYKEIMGEMIKDALLSKVSSLFGINAKSYFEKMSDDSNAIVEEYVAQIESRETLKSYLKKMGEIIKGEDGKNPPLVFIIDELDRCRPTFAIELLERIKHLFDIEGIVFVFGVNKKELQNTIRSVYGDIDAEIYLSRFFNLEYDLPQIEKKIFVQHLFEKHGIFQIFNDLKIEIDKLINVHRNYQIIDVDWADFFSNYVMLLLCRMDMSLRDIKKALSPIISSAHNVEDKAYSGIVLFFMVLRLQDKALYTNVINKICTAGEIMNYLRGEAVRIHKIDNKMDEINLSLYLDMIEAWLYHIDIVEKNASNEKLSDYAESNADNRGRICPHAKGIRYYLEKKKIVRMQMYSYSGRDTDISDIANFQGIPIRHIVEMIGSIEVDKQDERKR